MNWSIQADRYSLQFRRPVLAYTSSFGLCIALGVYGTYHGAFFGLKLGRGLQWISGMSEMK